MSFDSIPKVNPDRLCEAGKLCSVREKDNTYMVAVKPLNGEIFEIPLSDIIDVDEYKGLNIKRTYSSGHIFLNQNKDQVYLISVEKNGRVQHQFTGGSPREQIFSEIIYKDSEGKLKINITKVEDNAIERTKIRTGVDVTDVFNNIPLVDRVLIENNTDNNNKYWRLVLLMHFVVKNYDGELGYKKGLENVVGGNRYNIDDLPNTENVSTNAYIVTKKAQEITNN